MGTCGLNLLKFAVSCNVQLATSKVDHDNWPLGVKNVDMKAIAVHSDLRSKFIINIKIVPGFELVEHNISKKIMLCMPLS